MAHDSRRDAKQVVILAEDRKAARDYMRVHGSAESKQNEHLRQAQEELVAFSHAQRGEAQFRLVYGLRPPRCAYERALFDLHRDQLSAEEFGVNFHAEDGQPIDNAILRVYFEELEWSLDHFREFLTWFRESQQSDEQRPRTAKSPNYSSREMMRNTCLSKPKVAQVRQFVHDARVAKSLGRVRHGDTVAATAIDLFLLVLNNAVSHWKTCQQIAEASQVDPRYLYAITAEELFIDYVKQIRLVEIESMLAEEEAVCRWFLSQQQQSPPAPLVQNNFNIDGTGHTVTPHINVCASDLPSALAETVVEEAAATEVTTKAARPPRPDARPNLAKWAIGLDGSHRWWLFHQQRGRWEQSTELNVPKGNPDSILRLLAKRGGALDRAEVHALLKVTYSGKRPDELTRVCTDALQKAKTAIRQAIAECGHFEFANVPNPIPWDDPTWRADIGIGYVVQDEDGSPDFKTHDGLTGDDRLDRS